MGFSPEETLLAFFRGVPGLSLGYTVLCYLRFQGRKITGTTRARHRRAFNKYV